ncbi:MAG: CHRD domain-containing protein [Polaromonas sp.]|nr:CHRD domain-containing protein [Polaromonas sp.]MDP3413637.1 CHRD domain-containing protein [Polaromonas sp.]MDP3607305.1 CHRD domain-containing protein [Polaromonas sp.]
MTSRHTLRAAFALAAVFLIAGCGMMTPQSNTVALTTQLRGANEVPPVASNASGQVDAVLDKNTGVFKWQLSYSGLSGPATAGHFHGPAPVGANAGVALPFTGTVTSPMSGQATLTAGQMADLLGGKWYANIHTARYPGGEIRGQMTVRN